MSDPANSLKPARPEFRNIDFASLRSLRWPLASLASGMHRVSGAFLFLMMPFLIWMFDTSISSEISYARLTATFNQGMWGAPGFLWKLLALGIIWACLHHLLAGLRHLWMDTHHAHVTKEFGRRSAAAVLIATLGLTLVLGAKLFGLY